MNMAEARIWEMVEHAAKAVTDNTGQFEKKGHIDEIKARLTGDELPPHVYHATLDLQAKNLAERFVSRRNPRPGKKNGMFHPSAILPLGDGKRVWMEYATDTDLIEWARLATKNLARVAAAEGARQSYVADRLEAMRDRPGWTLGRIERDVYGYIEAEPPDDASPDDGDW
ncbi:MAG: hypothetical protein GEU83_11995 [Pseudonocardiaceae bacterium]|nr:hypothetical protein [Pseudonocardiaceae bacterium]